MERVIGFNKGGRAVVAILSADGEINRGARLSEHVQITIPLGAGRKIRGEQIGACTHDQRAGLPAAGHAVQIDAACVDVVMADEILGQGDGFVGGGLSPIVELRGEDDHPLVIMNGFRAEILDHIRAHALEIQPFPARQGDEQRIGNTAVIGFGNVAAEMNIADIAVKHIVVDKTALRLRAGRQSFFRRGRAAKCAQQ